MVCRRRYSVAILARTSAAINDRILVLNVRNPEANQALPGHMRALDAFVWAPLSSHSLVYRKARRNEVGSATQSSNAASPALTN